jgi:hypothetical protein
MLRVSHEKPGPDFELSWNETLSLGLDVNQTRRKIREISRRLPVIGDN